MNGFADNLRDEVLEAFNRLARGDFSFRAQGLIAVPLARACQGLTGAMQTVKEASDQISSGAVQVSESSSSLPMARRNRPRLSRKFRHRWLK